MLLVYNILIVILGIPLLPVFLLIILSRKKYRGRTLERLGLTVGKIQSKISPSTDGIRKGHVIWVHALSVGEVTSALPLVKVMRLELPEAIIVLTVATSSGKKTAENLLRPYVQSILSSPFDLRFAVQRYITALQPDLFIQVETDFWPNWLSLLEKKSVPTMLVNGRVSDKSFTSFQRFAFFFRPMFSSFHFLSMQTTEDRRKMTMLGVPSDKVIALGNLKYDMERPAPKEERGIAPLWIGKPGEFVWVCGSTHPGEEDILFAAFAQLLSREKDTEQCVLVLAPRDINRGQQLVSLASDFGLKAATRSSGKEREQVLILDTLGELAYCYGQAHIAFVGGSLVPKGGHNPIEPAIYGVPVLFGSHMEDFSEIARELIDSKGGKTVSAQTLTETLLSLFTDMEARTGMGLAAQAVVERHRGGVQRHVQVIQNLLS